MSSAPFTRNPTHTEGHRRASVTLVNPYRVRLGPHGTAKCPHATRWVCERVPSTVP